MTTFRKIFSWIKCNRTLSTGLVSLIGIFAITTVILTKRASGTLTAPLEKSTIVESVYGIGTIMASQSYQIKLGVICRIEELYVKEGDKVQKGDRLLNIDGSIYRAPFEGKVTSLPFKSGENVFTNLTILSLVNLLDRYLVVSLEQQGALRVLKGQKAIMSFDSIRNERYFGEVESVYSYNNNILARIKISDLPEIILPDMTADVAITIKEKNDVIIVPVEALDHGKIWIKRGKGLAHLTKVKIGIVDRAFAEILSGNVKRGDRILLKENVAPK